MQNEQNDHCQIIRDEFKLLDRYNSAQLGSFFVRYKFFSTNDLAQVLSLSSRYIRRLKERTDISRTRGRKVSPKPNINTVPDIKLEPGWDCGDWWRHYYKLYGLRILVKITHLSMKTVMKRLRTYNIQLRPKGSTPSNHPCRNYEWLYKHYVELDLGSVKCAKAAGVSPDTITSWLNAFKIQVKTRNAPKVGKTYYNPHVGEAACITVRTS
jgi:hypothetical protein